MATQQKPAATELADGVVERLKGVTIGAGYFTNLGRQAGRYVARRIRVLSQMDVSEFPSACVLVGPMRPSDAEQTGAHRMDHMVGVVLYARADAVTAELERLDADARKCLLGGTTLLPNAYGRLSWVESVPFYNEIEQTDRGLVLVNFRARRNWTPDEP